VKFQCSGLEAPPDDTGDPPKMKRHLTERRVRGWLRWFEGEYRKDNRWKSWFYAVFEFRNWLVLVVFCWNLRFEGRPDFQFSRSGILAMARFSQIVLLKICFILREKDASVLFSENNRQVVLTLSKRAKLTRRD